MQFVLENMNFETNAKLKLGFRSLILFFSGFFVENTFGPTLVKVSKVVANHSLEEEKAEV